jgi:hypothetical protein
VTSTRSENRSWATPDPAIISETRPQQAAILTLIVLPQYGDDLGCVQRTEADLRHFLSNIGAVVTSLDPAYGVTMEREVPP